MRRLIRRLPRRPTSAYPTGHGRPRREAEEHPFQFAFGCLDLRCDIHSQLLVLVNGLQLQATAFNLPAPGRLFTNKWAETRLVINLLSQESFYQSPRVWPLSNFPSPPFPSFTFLLLFLSLDFFSLASPLPSPACPLFKSSGFLHSQLTITPAHPTIHRQPH